MIWTSDPGGTSFQNTPNQKTILKVVYGTDAEPINTRGRNVTGKVKG